jgi:hypothetical protein
MVSFARLQTIIKLTTRKAGRRVHYLYAIKTGMGGKSIDFTFLMVVLAILLTGLA